MVRRPGGAAGRTAAVLVVSAALAGAAACAAPSSAGTPAVPTPVAGTPADPAGAAGAARSAPGTCSAFSLSLVSDRGGRPSPVAAAEWFSGHGGVPEVPAAGWQPAGTDGAGATVRSGAVTLHAVRGPDGTWQVDSGSWC